MSLPPFVRDLGMSYPTSKSKSKRHFAIYKCPLCDSGFKSRTDSIHTKKGCPSCSVTTKKIALFDLPEKINNINIIKDLGMNNDSPSKREAIFICFCGREFIAKVNAVATGQKKSCGCYKKKYPNNFTHGLSRTILYRKWSGMITRCTNKKESHWHRYGGRGILVCDEWRDNFKSFHDWSLANGYKVGLTIDRKDNDGNYEPDNCQWITMAENTIKDRNSTYLNRHKDKEICSRYENENITITNLSKEYRTYKAVISAILKRNKIKIKHRRMKCY